MATWLAENVFNGNTLVSELVALYARPIPFTEHPVRDAICNDCGHAWIDVGYVVQNR